MSSTVQNTVLIFLGLLVAFIVVRQIIIPLLSKRPENLGAKNGRFTPCRKTPNCVSTQADPGDKQHYITPLKYGSTKEEAIDKIVDALQNIGGSTKVITQRPDYIHAENRSPTMRYVDDVEIYFDDSRKEIHFKSASRLGYSDFGMNRKRINQIKTQFKE